MNARINFVVRVNGEQTEQDNIWLKLLEAIFYNAY